MRSASRRLSRIQWRRAFLLGGAALLTLGLAASLLAALEALAVTRPSVAWANGGSSGAFTDTTAAEFGAACAVLTNATVSPASGGEVRLAATLEDYFDGASLNTSLWITGTATDFYTVPITVAGGAVTLNSNFLRAQANFQAVQPRFYEARVQQAVNTAAPGNTVVGFAREDRPGSPITDTSASRIFIGPATEDMYARWRDGAPNPVPDDLTISPNPDLTQYRLFRIEWEPGETRWYIDDVLTATLTQGVTTLNTWVWLYAQDPDAEMNVDWIRAGQYAASGSYLSCARDAGGVVNWSALTATASTPAGAGLALRTRTSLDGVNWSAWSAPLTSTLVTSPSGRYFQYLAEMTSASGVRSPELQQVRVDYFGPTTAQLSPSPVTLDPGEVRQFSAQGYDANGRPVGSLNFAWGVVNGGGSINSSGLFTAVLTPGTYLNTVSATVPTTGGPVTGLSTVTVRDLAPTANAGGPYTVSEGVTATLAGSGADPNGLAVILDWDLDNDGSFETASQSSPAFYRGDNGLFTVRLRVTENGGAGLTTTVTSPVTVTNAAPTATFSVTATTVAEGSPFGALLTDPFDLGEADRVAGFTYSFDCGGGGGYGSFGLNNTANCSTNDNAVRTVRGRIQDKDGGITEYTRSVTVTNVTPAVSILGAPASSPEGTEIALTSVITDPATADTHTYVWSVTKEGGPYASGTAAAFSFTPNDNGAYLVTLTATDDDGASGEDSRLITVTNVGPAATFTASPTSVPEGSPFDLSLADPSDASSVDSAVGFTYAFSCAGGGFGSYSAISATTCSTTDNGVRTVGGRIRDKDGGVMEYTRTVTVTNVAPVVTITGAPGGSVPEGTAVTLGRTLTDPGTDTHTYAWSVTKNGNAYESGAGLGFTFTPDDNGTYVVTLTATDDDGGQGTDSITLTVTNAAPAVAIKDAPAISPVGREVTLTNTVTDPGTADTHTYAWSVTKDGSPYASGTGATFSFTPDEVASYVVTVQVTDDDGGAGSHAVTIASLYQISLPVVVRGP